MTSIFDSHVLHAHDNAEEKIDIVEAHSNQTHKRHDIVGSLPLELLLQIVEYVDPADVVRYQRVSKRWRSIFSCDAITRVVMRQTLAFLSMESTDVASADVATYFRWRHGLQCGRPVKKIFLPWSRRESIMPADFVYHSRRLFYRSLYGYEIEMLDLETGRRSTWVEEDAQHEGLFRLLASDCYAVTFGDNGDLTAWDIHTSQHYEERLPRTFWQTSMEKDKVVAVNALSSSIHPIYIWDLGAHCIREIGSFSNNLWLWHVDADKNILVTFEFDWGTDPVEVQQTKWALTGRLLDRKHFHLSLSGHRVEKRFVRPLLVSGNLTYGNITVKRMITTRGANFTMDLMYDYAIDKLSVRWNDCAQPIMDYSDSPFYAMLTPHIAYFWDNCCRRLEIFNADNQTTTTHPHQLDVRELNVHRWFYFPLPGNQSEGMMDDDPLLLPFGDREVFGLAGTDGIQLWFFNPDFTPDIPGAEPFSGMDDDTFRCSSPGHLERGLSQPSSCQPRPHHTPETDFSSSL